MSDVKRSTLYTRLNGTQPRNKAHEDQQHLLNAEERALAQWIRQMTCVNHAPSHPIVRYMAEFIRSHRVRKVNDQFAELVQYEPLGEQWVTRFMTRHPQLQTVLPQSIEGAHVKDSSYEALKTYFKNIQEAIKEHNI